MKRKIKAGSTSHIEPIVIDDSSSITGAGLGSLVYNSAGLAAKYKRAGAASWTSFTLATATAGTWTTEGFIESDSGAVGSYELHIPDAAIAAGVDWVHIEAYGATNMAPVRILCELDGFDYAGGIAASVSGAVGSVTGAVGSVTGAAGSVTGAVGSVAGNVDGSVASVTGAVGSLTGHTVQTGDTYGIANGATGFAAIDTVVDAILVDTATTLQDEIGYLIAILAGALSNAGTATETYSFTLAGTAYTATYAGLDASGNRGTTVLSKV